MNQDRGPWHTDTVIACCPTYFNRVPTRPGKPGKMTVHLEISWNFEKFNKYHGKMTKKLEKLGGY